MSLKRKMERRRMTENIVGFLNPQIYVSWGTRLGGKPMITNVEVIVRLENKTALLWRNLKSSSKGWLAIAKLKPLSLFISLF